MSYHDQVPWFATSNGVIDLKTSADFRDKKYTNNDINHNNNENSMYHCSLSIGRTEKYKMISMKIREIYLSLLFNSTFVTVWRGDFNVYM